MRRGTGRPRFNERMVLSPLLSQRVQARAREIFGSHGNPKLYFGVEREKQRFGQRRDIGRTVDVDHKGSPTATVVLGKIGGFRLDGLKNLLDLWPDTAVSNGGVERFGWELNVH